MQDQTVIVLIKANMKNYNFCIQTVFILLLPLLASSQNGTTAAGNSVSNTNYQIGFTIGESIISSYSEGESSVANGIIQPTEVIVISTDDFIGNEISIFPNPATTLLNVTSEGQDLKTFEILTMDSKKIHSGLIENDQIDMSSISTGLYIVKLKSYQKTYSTMIKIINI